MTLPNFLIIGAAKCGTSSIYMYLKQHPEIFMSPIKEPHYFSFTSETKKTQGPGDSVTQAITEIEEYKNLFNDVQNEKAIGEASPTYIYQPNAAERIQNLIPNAKLIAILRNPAERAFSAYMHVVRDRREPAGPLWHYRNCGFYFEQLTRYFNLFPKDQIQVFTYEDLRSDQEGVLKNIFKFLDVDTNFIPDISVKFNVSGKQKSKLLHSLTLGLFNNPNPIRWLSRHIVPESLRWKVTNRIRELNLISQKIPEKIKAELINGYRYDIIKLQTLIDRDLSHWLEL